MALKITSDNFEKEVLNSSEPVLVDFWADWCQPCRMLAPTIDELDAEDNGIKVGKVNVDEEVQLAYDFNVRSIPTVVCFKNGKAAAKTVGVQSKEELLKLVWDNSGD